MAPNAKVDWYGDEMMVVVDGANDELLTQLAFYAEAEAKANEPVDTGFMRAATYAIAAGGNHRSEAAAQAMGRADRELAPPPSVDVDNGEAAVHGAAEYTIYQENRVGFLYRALEAAAQAAGGMIRAVGRQFFG